MPFKAPVACVALYEARIAQFQILSGAPATSAVQRFDHPDEDERVRRTYEHADEQVTSCWDAGGRYWEVRVELWAYFDSLLHNRSAPYPALQIAADPGRDHYLPKAVLGGLCAPSICEKAAVESHIIPRYLQRLLHLSDALPPPVPGQAQANELARWSELSLSFVVAGVNSCGTNSLLNNLEGHPDIAFTQVDYEDPFFFHDDGILPYRERVQAFNEAAMATLSAAGTQERPARYLGLRHPGLFNNARVRKILKEIPTVRVILVVCDPLSRFEKVVWAFHLCRRSKGVPATDSATMADVAGVGLIEESSAVVQSPCFTNITAAANEGGYELFNEWRIGPHVRSLARLLALGTSNSRLLLVHQDSLRSSPIDAYDSMASFIGAAPFPSSTSFGRWNRRGGHRTELCMKPAVRQVLRRLLESEYEALEDLLLMQQRSPPHHGASLPLPTELLLRRSRCDREEELVNDWQNRGV